MAGWSVIPAVSYPYGRQGSSTKEGLSEMTGIKRLEEPGYAEKQQMKQEGEGMLPNQYQWFNASLQSLDMEERSLKSNMAQYFAKSHGKPPDQDTQQGWNRTIMNLERKKLQVKSLEGTFKQNFKSYYEELKKDQESPNSSLHRIATINFNGVPLMVKGEKSNGQIGPLSGAELMQQYDSLPGMSNFGSPVNIETEYSGTFDKFMNETFEKAAKSRTSEGADKTTIVGSDEVKYMNIISSDTDRGNVMNAASQILNTLPSKESADLRSMFYEHLMQGGLTPEGKWGMDFYMPGKDDKGNDTIVNHGYEFTSEESRVIQKYFNGDDLDSSDLRVMGKAYQDFGINMVMSAVPAKINVTEKNEHFKVEGSTSGGTIPTTPYARIMFNQPTATTSLSMIGANGRPGLDDEIGRFQLAWESWYNQKMLPNITKIYSGAYEKAKGGDDERRLQAESVTQKYISDFADPVKYKADLAKRMFGSDYENVLQGHSRQKEVREYHLDQKAFLDSGFKLADPTDMKYWAVNDNGLSSFDKSQFSVHAPLVIGVDRIFKGDALFDANHETLARAQVLVHKDDLKNFKFVVMDAGKPKKINYEELRKNYPELSKNWIRKMDIKEQALMEQVFKGMDTKDKMNIVQQVMHDETDYFDITLYVSEDRIIEEAYSREAGSSAKIHATTNPALGEGVIHPLE